MISKPIPTQNTKTLLITGGSRGIGLAIAQRFSAENWNVVVLAKETSSEPSLKQIESTLTHAGSAAKVLDVDIREYAQIQNAISKAVETFGGIDVVVNNTSAFCFTSSLETTPDKFNMLMETNTRGTFFVSQLCLPYLIKSQSPYIINNSPPLSMKAKWFKNHLPFTLSKYGMSLYTLGMAEEFKEKGISVCSIWPQTTIATTTIKDHFLPEIYAGSRWPSIMADAVYAISQKEPQKVTGRFFIDEEVLRESGITDFSSYAVDPTAPLIQDLFTSEDCPDITSLMKPLLKEDYKINTTAPNN